MAEEEVSSDRQASSLFVEGLLGAVGSAWLSPGPYQVEAVQEARQTQRTRTG